MKKIIAIIALATIAALCGCSHFRENHTAANPEIKYRELRIDVVAKGLVKDGTAPNLDEARKQATVIVDKEIADQKYAGRENAEEAKTYQFNQDKRVDAK
jgi:hypothetical protein